MNNKDLNRAKRAKNDEFYTQYVDIEKECQHYIEHFKDQWIYLPCDTEESNFWKYFVDHFHEYGLKRLTATHINLDGLPSYRIDYNGSEVIKTALKGNGDFRSEYCIELLKKSDIVVTNPPFSLFREFVATLEKYNKKYLIIGNGNAVTYKEIFPLIKDNKMWLGAGKGMGGKAMEFIVNENIYDSTKGCVNRIENGVCYVGVMMCTWFTNLEHDKRNNPLYLYKHYNPEDYPKYDNYDAIEVSKVCNIPIDYDDVMGVPITFLDKYCPEQFEILFATDIAARVNSNKVYKRIFIRIKK